MRRLLLGLLLLFPASAGRADDVRLRNGKTFEGVIAVERGAVVEVRIPGGTISLPKTSVREIVHSASPYGEYLERAGALRAGGSARGWLDLARWARNQELDGAAREAALAAAELDPKLDGLAPFLRGLGYELDESEGRWLPLPEVMRRQGMVLADGRWMTRGEADELYRRAADEARERRRQREVDRLERATAEVRLAAAEIELSRAGGGAQNYPAMVMMPSAYLWPVAAFPGFPMPPFVPVPVPPDAPHHRPPHRHVAESHRGTLTLDMITRQPGSLFPGELDLSGSSTARPR
jgi:hypothetical protein